MIKKCGKCKCEYGQEGWDSLPLVALWEEVQLELRNCPCGSTIAIEMPGHAEKTDAA